MSFIFEEKQPVLFSLISIYFYLYCAGVDFVRFIQVFHLALALELFDCYGAYVHQRHRLGSAQRLSDFHVSVESFLQSFIFKFYIVDDRIESRVAAMV